MMYSIAVLVLTIATCCLATRFSNEQRLVDELLSDDVTFTVVRPAGDSNHMITVNMSISLNGIKSFDTSTGNIELMLWKSLSWTDNRLVWDKEEFGGVDHIQLPSNKIWTPDIVLYTGTEVTLPPEKAVLAYSDYVNYVSTSVAQVPCTSDDSSGDKWTCTLIYGSWAYNGEELDLQPNGQDVGISFYWPKEWELSHSSVNRRSVLYECCPELYIDIVFTMTLTRRTKH